MSEAPAYTAKHLRPIATANDHESLAATAGGKAAKKSIMLVVSGRLIRNCIERVLEASDRIIVSGCETLDQVEAALEAMPTPSFNPDLFIVGIAGPGRAAEEFAYIRALRAKLPGSRWIVLSRNTDLDFLCEAIESGIEGLLLEDSPSEALELVAELVLLGNSSLPVSLAQTLATALRPAAPSAAPVPSARPRYAVEVGASQASAPPMDPSRRWQVSLSDRETEILHGLVAGHPNKLIARKLSIAEATVKVHVKALLRKMQVTNRTQAAISAMQFLRNTEGTNWPDRVLEAEPVLAEADSTILIEGKPAGMFRASGKAAFGHPPAE